MAGSGVLPALLAGVAAPAATTTHVTAQTTSAAAAAANATACWPGTCSPDLAVSFRPDTSDADSQSLHVRGAAAFAGVFGLLALVHLLQGGYYRWKPATVAVVGGLAATTGHVLQAVGSAAGVDWTLQPYFLVAAFVLLQLPPLCITLYVDLVLKQLAHTRFLPEYDNLTAPVKESGRDKPVWPSGSRWIAHWSILALLACAAAAQLVAITVLVYGGLSTIFAGHVGRVLLMVTDLVWAAGFAAQGFVVLLLLIAVTHVFASVPPARPGGQQERGVSGFVPALSLPPRRRMQLLWLLGSTYVVLALLMMRIVYKSVEIVEAVKVALTPHGKTALSSKSEQQMLFALVFEALPTCIALALLGVFHVGWALPLRDVQHVRSTGDVDGEREMGRGSRDLREVADAEAASFGISGLQPPTQSPAWIVAQQRAIIQRQRQQQRQQWQRQWQLHAETAAARQTMQSVSLPSSPALQALARSSLSASLPISLPRDSFVAERPSDDQEQAAAADQASGSRPARRLARLSRENFILFRFLNATLHFPSSDSGGWRARSRTANSGSRQSQQTPHGNTPKAGSQGSSSLLGDPFVGFDDVAVAGRHDYDRTSHETESARGSE
ncbi:hypothetical protein SEPCBS119000_000786 [Sporothrix epigloea]|uniref:Uncharacterized protein n=1 Tax=Sporothrix epigloea TaxID=1892477 RepID=A0ABP0D753_9PEZI